MSISSIVATLFVGSLALAAVSPVHAMFNSFLKMEGVPGEVTTDLPQPPQPPKFAAPPSQPSAAVPIPAFMKNARKAKTAEGPAKLNLRAR